MPKRTICLCMAIAVLLGSACGQNADAPNNANYYERCDTTNNNGWVRRQLEQLSPAARAEREVQRSARLLLDALQQNDLDAAQPYTTKRGLGTLLYIDMEQIDHYEIIDLQINHQKATARLKINQAEQAIRFYFEKKDTLWRFVGIDLADVDKGTPFRN